MTSCVKACGRRPDWSPEADCSFLGSAKRARKGQSLDVLGDRPLQITRFQALTDGRERHLKQRVRLVTRSLRFRPKSWQSHPAFAGGSEVCGCKLLKRLAPQVGLEPIRLRFATDDSRWVAKLRRDLAEARRAFASTRRRAEAANPPVNWRVETAIRSDQTLSLLRPIDLK